MPGRLVQTFHVWYAGPRAVGVTLPSQEGLGLDEHPHGSTSQDTDHPPPPDLDSAVVRPRPAIPSAPARPTYFPGLDRGLLTLAIRVTAQPQSGRWRSDRQGR